MIDEHYYIVFSAIDLIDGCRLVQARFSNSSDNDRIYDILQHFTNEETTGFSLFDRMLQEGLAVTTANVFRYLLPSLGLSFKCVGNESGPVDCDIVLAEWDDNFPEVIFGGRYRNVNQSHIYEKSTPHEVEIYPFWYVYRRISGSFDLFKESYPTYTCSSCEEYHVLPEYDIIDSAKWSSNFKSFSLYINESCMPVFRSILPVDGSDYERSVACMRSLLRLAKVDDKVILCSDLAKIDENVSLVVTESPRVLPDWKVPVQFDNGVPFCPTFNHSREYPPLILYKREYGVYDNDAQLIWSTVKLLCGSRNIRDSSWRLELDDPIRRLFVPFWGPPGSIPTVLSTLEEKGIRLIKTVLKHPLSMGAIAQYLLSYIGYSASLSFCESVPSTVQFLLVADAVLGPEFTLVDTANGFYFYERTSAIGYSYEQK